MLPDLKVFLLLGEDLVETLDLTPFQIEFLFDFVDSRLVLLQEHVKLSHVHLSNSTVVVADA